jgi:hypothetical protein
MQLALHQMLSFGAMAGWHGWRQEQPGPTSSPEGWQDWRQEQTEQVGQGVREREEDETARADGARLAQVEREVSELRRMIDELLRVQAGSSSASSSASHRLTRVEQDIWDVRRMIKEWAAPPHLLQPAGTQAASCLHGGAELFVQSLNESIECYLVFVGSDGETGLLESALWSARDSSRFNIPAAPMALDVIASWGVGKFGVEIHKGKSNSYVRFGCRGCNRATAQLFKIEEFQKIFNDVFMIGYRADHLGR